MDHKKIIIPAIIAETQQQLLERINKVKDYSVIIQLDIMDGVFVPNRSIDFDFKLPKTNCRFEAHLMINNPMEWINKNWKKIDMALIHFESCKNHMEIIKTVKKLGRKVGFALNPETPVEEVREYLNDIDQILVMTVNPGFYGSSFLPETLGKIREIRRMKPDLNIEVDGGINPDTIRRVHDAGANMFVSGSYIVKSDDVKKAMDVLRKMVTS